jgi:hypothetical protein
MMQMGSLKDYPRHLYPKFTLTLASLLPFTIFLFRRRRSRRGTVLLFVPLFAITLGAATLLQGCSSNSTPPPTPTPTGLSQVSVVAMSTTTGLQQSYNIALTVQ